MAERRKMGHLILTVLAATLLPVPALASWNAAKIAVTPDSAKSVLIIKTQHIPISYPYQTGFRLNLSGYDAEHESLARGTVVFGSKEKHYFDGYLVREVKPGTYVIKDFSRQDRWSLCFNDNSFQFTVQPGQAIYLGELDSVARVNELENFAISSGRNLSRNSAAVHFFDNVTAPFQSPIDADDLDSVATMMAARMTKTTVQPVAVDFKPARFGTGSDLFGMNRVCGGYYTGKAKSK